MDFDELKCLLFGHKFENKYLVHGHYHGGWRVVFTKERIEKKTECKFPLHGLAYVRDEDKSGLLYKNRYPGFQCKCDRCLKQYLIPANDFYNIMNKKTLKLVPDIFVNGQLHFLGMTEAQKTEIPVFISKKAYECVESQKRHKLNEDFHLQKQEDGSYIGSFETEIKLSGSNLFRSDVFDKIKLKIFNKESSMFSHEDEYEDKDICQPATNYEFLLPFPKILCQRTYFPRCYYSWSISNKKGTFEPTQDSGGENGYINLVLPMWGDFGGEIKINLYITSARTEAEESAFYDAFYEQMHEKEERDKERQELAKAIADEFRKG